MTGLAAEQRLPSSIELSLRSAVVVHDFRVSSLSFFPVWNTKAEVAGGVGSPLGPCPCPGFVLGSEERVLGFFKSA